MTKCTLRGGNTSLIKNGQVYGNNNNCIRQVVVRDLLGQPRITDTRARLTFGMGLLSEKIVVEDMITEGRTVKADFEVVDIITDNTSLCGHIDVVEKISPQFWPDLPVDTPLLYELKSVSSIRTAEKVFKEFKPKMENITQLANYMIAMNVTNGILQYTSVIYMEKLNAGDCQKYLITIDDKGEIIYKPITKKGTSTNTGYNVSHIMKYRQEAAAALENKEVYPVKPQNFDGGFFSPCKGCWLQPVCEDYDQHGDSEAFYQQAEELLNKIGKREIGT